MYVCVCVCGGGLRNLQGALEQSRDEFPPAISVITILSQEDPGQLALLRTSGLGFEWLWSCLTPGHEQSRLGRRLFP